MATTPPPNSPRGKPPSMHPMQAPLEDYSEFEGDPTNINQMPQYQGTPRPS